LTLSPELHHSPHLIIAETVDAYTFVELVAREKQVHILIVTYNPQCILQFVNIWFNNLWKRLIENTPETYHETPETLQLDNIPWWSRDI